LRRIAGWPGGCVAGEAVRVETSPQAAGGAVRYERHRPETTLLYQLVARHYPAFLATLSAHGRTLPSYVQQEFAAYLKCGRLEHGFLRVRCTACHAERLVAFSCKRRGFCPSCAARRMTESAALLVDEVLPHEPLRQWVFSVPFPLRYLFATDAAAMGAVLSIVYRAIAAHLVRKAGLTQATARTGAVTLIQRFGSALNLNIHFHLLVLDGVYVPGEGAPQFRRVPPPTAPELEAVLGRIVARIARHLERRGLLVRDVENSYLSAGPGESCALEGLLGHSITYRIAVGPNEGRKAFRLQSLVPALTAPAGDERLAKHSGFSLHAGVSAAAHQREKIERLCRYIARPAVATGRLALTAQGLVRYTLKTPYRDGTTHVIFEPLDFLARLAVLVPKPRVHLTRYHGVFAPHSALRAEITPAGRGRSTGTVERSPAERHRALRWAQRLKRVFRIDIERCEHCGGKVRIIASIENPEVIGRILAHLEQRAATPCELRPAHPPRGPPGQGVLELD
jgi:hypothetical protein